MTTPLLSVENLSVAFETHHGQVKAVDQVSFSVGHGEALGIVGESGSGKSVVCRAMLQLFAANARVTNGRILHDGHDVLTMTAEELARYRGEKAAMIFQNPSTHLDPIMKVGAQVAEGLIAHRGMTRPEAAQKAVELLDTMQIIDPVRRANAYPHELSGGMRQRVMIAAALACAPGLLIADEPTTALDVTVQAQILTLIRQIRTDRKLTLILVSHDLGVISEMCDRIVVMKDGKVVEQGATAQILRDPQQDYTRNLIRAQPSLLPIPERTARTSPAEPMITIKNLSVSFSHPRSFHGWLVRSPKTIVQAVDKASLSLRKGGSLGIVGESGSGKSTLARAIVGLVSPESGTIDIAGVQTARDRPRFVQMAFQDPFLSLNPAYTLEQTLAEPFIAHGLCAPSEIPHRLKALMQQVELPPALLKRRPGQLSGGQRQRVGIARALAMSPHVLIADEVTSALDVSIQAQILSLFKDLQRDLGLTLMLISHDLAVVRYLCEDVAVMRHGKIVEFGPTSDVFDHPQTDYTRTLLAAVPKISLPLTRT